MKRPTIERIHEVMQDNRMKVFTKPFDCTLGWIRTSDNASNAMNDWIFMSYFTEGGGIVSIVFEGTTDAGLYYRLNPIHIDGTAIIQHGKQYRGTFRYMEVGGHRGGEGMRQVRNLDYFRDPDRDKYLNFVNPQFDKMYNTNGHTMGDNIERVDKHSAGCWGSIVDNMRQLYDMAKVQISHGYGDMFSLAALHENMF